MKPLLTILLALALCACDRDGGYDPGDTRAPADSTAARQRFSIGLNTQWADTTTLSY